MGRYVIPEEYYFRIHHVRPRFKNNIEDVLIYLAEQITSIGTCETDEFNKKLNAVIRRYPGNQHRAEKTINNWRTEISALFSFILVTGDKSGPARSAVRLAENQDLVEAFKYFLYTFQYPGGHIKPKYILEEIQAGIHFKPAQYILQLLKYANGNKGNSEGITKFEVCHCIFNDLRVTRDNEGVEKTWKRIVTNRKNHVEYDTTGDVIRYAGDIIDYMEKANLLKTYDHYMYYLNRLEEENIIKFCKSEEWFTGYDHIINGKDVLSEIASQNNLWIQYVNRDMQETDFATDILAYIGENNHELKEAVMQENAVSIDENTKSDFINRQNSFEQRIQGGVEKFSTKDIGDIGEGLVHGHECMRLKLAGRPDLIHLIKRIPTELAVGYDISSIETDERRRYIEVKTTISSKSLDFNHIHMTKNEWRSAETVRDRYYVYRLMISKSGNKLFLLQNPVGLYKEDKIFMTPADGADINFDPNQVGNFEELLIWKD